jgi:hypothetical protein
LSVWDTENIPTTAQPSLGWYDQLGVFHPYTQEQQNDPTLSYLIMAQQKMAEIEARLIKIEARIEEIKRELEELIGKK